MATVISVEHLSKTYQLGQIGTGTLTNDLKVWWAKKRGLPNPMLRIGESDNGNPSGGHAGTSSDGETIWALKDVSFTVEQGEVLGIIGRNGAGKSTLLKVLSRITAPTSGKVKVKGRVASLLEVGTGFHPELTGRENIYLNGAILGMNRKEIDRKFDEIVDFAEIEKFIDTPVKRYSSGMYVRLAFAVAAHLEPEILLVDEVLAVGDAEFQKKCLGKMGDIAHEGRTVLFVSHNLGAISGLAVNGLLLSSGMIRCSGAIGDVVKSYVGSFDSKDAFQRRNASSRAYIEAANIIGPRMIESGQKLAFEAYVRSQDEFDVSLDWRLKDEQGSRLVFGCPHVQLGRTDRVAPGLTRFLIGIGPLPLAEGHYRISLDLDVPWIEYLDRLEDCLEFSIISCVLGSPGHSMKAAWGHGSMIVPFDVLEVAALGCAGTVPMVTS